MVSEVIPRQTIGVRVPIDLLEKLDADARKERRTRGNLVCKIIADYYQEA